MIYLKTTTTFLFLLCLNVILAATPSKIDFIANNIEEAKRIAKQENKLIMVDFWADWCSPCKWMDEYTFTDDNLANYLNTNYVSVKVDIDNAFGMDFKKQYELKVLPTILILDPYGNVVKRYDESFAPSKLRTVLEMHNQQNKQFYMIQAVPKENSSKTKPEVKEAPKPILGPPATTGTSATKLAENAERSSAPATTYEQNNNTINATTGDANTNNNLDFSSEISRKKEGDYYVPPVKPNVEKEYMTNTTQKVGYSVQIGAFNDYGNAMAVVEKVRDTFGEKVLVEQIALNGKTQYKVMLGEYSSYEAANKDKMIYVQDGFSGAFIKKITN